MRPLEALEANEARRLVGVVFDLDDTVLDHGALSERAYSALFKLRDAGLRLIACTGRPTGWAEVIQRQWPVDITVAENGAVAVTKNARGVVTFVGDFDRIARKQARAPLLALAAELVAKHSEAALADDNDARLTDVTIDIGEHRHVDAAAVDAMKVAARSFANVRTTSSSVHLHLTRDPFDKASGTIRALVEHFGDDATSARSRYAFIGDSGNDAAAFAAFKTTLGVRNVIGHLRGISVPPRFVSASAMGAGFAQIVARLAMLRSGA